MIGNRKLRNVTGRDLEAALERIDEEFATDEATGAELEMLHLGVRAGARIMLDEIVSGGRDRDYYRMAHAVVGLIGASACLSGCGDEGLKSLEDAARDGDIDALIALLRAIREAAR